MNLRRVALLAVVPLLVACGGEDDPEPSGASDEPTVDESAPEEPDADEGACSLLTVEEVAEAVGAEVAEGVESGASVVTGGSQSTCVWTATEGASTATLTVYTDASAADSVRTDDSLPLPEVGNDAFIGPFASVYGYKAEGSFMAQWYEFAGDDEENLPKSIALAQRYLALD